MNEIKKDAFYKLYVVLFGLQGAYLLLKDKKDIIAKNYDIFLNEIKSVIRKKEYDILYKYLNDDECRDEIDLFIVKNSINKIKYSNRYKDFLKILLNETYKEELQNELINKRINDAKKINISPSKISITKMGFDLMTIFLLQSNDIKTLDDLLNKYSYDILSINGIKKENYEEIITKLEFFNLSLKSKKIVDTKPFFKPKYI